MLAIAATASAVQSAVLCKKKKSGVVVIRDACRKKETKIDLGQFGAAGPPGAPGAPGGPGSPGSQGPMGPALVVKDASGTLVGVVTSIPHLDGALNVIQVTVARQVGDAVVMLDADASGFLQCGTTNSYSYIRNLYYTTSDCSGAPFLAADAAPTLAAVACLDPTTHLAYYPTGTGTSLAPVAYRAITVSGLGGCQPTSGAASYYAPASTLDLAALGLVPPFHVEGP